MYVVIIKSGTSYSFDLLKKLTYGVDIRYERQYDESKLRIFTFTVGVPEIGYDGDEFIPNPFYTFETTDEKRINELVDDYFHLLEDISKIHEKYHPADSR